MYKHRLRKKVFEQGQWRTKIVHTDAELGSGILDINGKEIFEGDKVKFRDTTRDCNRIYDVTFSGGHFRKGHLLLGAEDLLEVVGHAED